MILVFQSLTGTTLRAGGAGRCTPALRRRQTGRVLWRAGVGIVAIAVGVVWMGQGLGSIHGSFMTGHSQYTALGSVLVGLGLALLAWAAWLRRRMS